eukprot:Gregarina_sp_Poly_1__4033@NODE_221_length_11248_cov_177_758072_g195_i0_p15_GENE_NODE_221_length_11248_cov_177_758072_g195_i0NODE_221_length_11248_cov_177_758072_g195_i0_p15_ORF_typecomplete_len111_score1_05Chitin_bind_1/PF00187_19/0_091Chitin_bind_1/PF00187_19/6_9e03_NODE_221_length_11248_cov_177_758072_g195_i046004932
MLCLRWLRNLDDLPGGQFIFPNPDTWRVECKVERRRESHPRLLWNQNSGFVTGSMQCRVEHQIAAIDSVCCSHWQVCGKLMVYRIPPKSSVAVALQCGKVQHQFFQNRDR